MPPLRVTGRTLCRYAPQSDDMERANPTYAAELEAKRRRRVDQRRKQVRRARAIAALLGVFLVIGVVVLVWALAGSGGPRYVRALDVPFPSPVDLIAPSILYAKDYAAKLPPPGPPPLVPAPGVKTIVIDRSDQVVTLYKADGTPVDQFPCATGQTYPRVGTYKVTSRKSESSYPAEGLRFAYFTIFTKSDKGTNIGFHSIPVDKSGNLVGGLGTPDSHGCVRLEKPKAKTVYDWASNGTKVIVQK